jgi:hypothetical protein
LPLRNSMKNTFLIAAFLVFCSTSVGALAAAAIQPAAKAHAAAEPAQHEISYTDLEKQIGKTVVVHTKLGTVRTGVLTKYKSTMIDIQLEGGADLTITESAIKSVSISVTPSDSSSAVTGDSSAKKN